jgi:hypothetical protein
LGLCERGAADRRMTTCNSAARLRQILCDTFDPTRGGAADDHVQVGPRPLVILQSSG